MYCSKEIADNYQKIRENIEQSCQKAGRDASEIRIVAVSKRQPIERMHALTDYLGDRKQEIVFGESRVQEYKQKKDLFPKDIKVHLIGPLQRNKAKDAVKLFPLIESVDSLKLAREINKAALKNNIVQDIFLQVNISRDENKGGFSDEDLPGFLENEFVELKGLSLRGLMTITRYYEDLEAVRPDFRTMRNLYDRIIAENPGETVQPGKRFELSMGMSSDYDIAVEEGATMVRIGTALFGVRKG